MQVRHLNRPRQPGLARSPYAMAGRRAARAGFALIELVAGLMIMALLAGVLSTLFSGDASKATRLYVDMKAIKNAMNRVKMDVGGFPRNLSVLWDRSAAVDPDNFFNGVSGYATWNGPYLERQAMDHSGRMVLDWVSTGASLEVFRVQQASQTNYFLVASNIPNPIIVEGMRRCVGVENTERPDLWDLCHPALGESPEAGRLYMRDGDTR